MRLALSTSSLIILPLILSGCALKNNAAPESLTGTQLAGKIHGGQQPVAGAHVYLFAAGTTGYGAASTSLLTSGTVGSDSLGQYVATDTTGAFSIPASSYTCVSGTQLYVLATQGNPGLPGNQTNPNLALMAAIGQCSASGAIGTASFIFVNEVTTIASVYALSGFMTDLAHVSSSGTPLAQTGIANAFATVNNLVDISTGTARATTPAGNGTVPQAEINSLANILASCVNSTGAASTPCTTLFANTQHNGTAPTDTTTAALYIAQNPAANISNLFSIPLPATLFQPALSSAPNDFTIALNFTGGGLEEPIALAIDGDGDIWAVSSVPYSINKFNGTTGAAISPSTGFTAQGLTIYSSIAIDNSGNAWTTGSTGSSTSDGAVVELNSAGGQVSPSTGYDVIAANTLSGITIDGSDDVWALGELNNLIELNGSTGDPISPLYAGYRGGGLSGSALAIDNSGNVWAANFVIPGTASEFNGSTGAAISTSAGYALGTPSDPIAIAVDSKNDIWIATRENYEMVNFETQVANYGTIVKLNGSTGAPISPSAGYTGGTLFPRSIAIDGIGNVWIAATGQTTGCNQICGDGNLVELNGSTGNVMSGSTGYVGGSLYFPVYLAIDGSGNIWVANGTTTASEYGTSLVEFIGAAAPVVTPLATAAATHSIATRP